jgi:hypothetical protein
MDSMLVIKGKLNEGEKDKKRSGNRRKQIKGII